MPTNQWKIKGDFILFMGGSAVKKAKKKNIAGYKAGKRRLAFSRKLGKVLEDVHGLHVFFWRSADEVASCRVERHQGEQIVSRDDLFTASSQLAVTDL